MRRLEWMLLVMLVVASVPARAASPARVLIDLENLPGDADYTERYALALALSDTSAAWDALEDAPANDPRARWLAARLWFAQEDARQSVSAVEEAARLWESEGLEEPPEVVRQLDRDRLRFACAAGDLELAQRIVDGPLAAHDDDPRWDALRASMALAAGRAPEAARLFEQAWSRADGWERRHPAFGRRALALLADGDAQGAASAWFDFVEGVAWPPELRAAVALWDENPRLHEAVAQDGCRPRLIAWLTRILRRDDAYEVARAGWQQAPPEEAAACYVAAAEQLYRLRRHDDLTALLAEPHPAALDDEQEATLAAYPWGVRRRLDPSAEVAEGFDAIVRDHPGTKRAIEALWEAAWVWELAGNADAAASRFRRYAEEFPRGPFVDSAAVRAIFLPYKAGRSRAALDAFDACRTRLKEGLNEAAALWLAARIHEAEGDPERAQALIEELARRSPGNPFLSPPPFPLVPFDLAATCELEDVLESLFSQQHQALERLAAHLGVADLESGLPEDLVAAERLLQLGMFWEGDGLLNAFAASQRSDSPSQLRAMAVAWRQGRPERQARIAFLLERRLSGSDEGLDRDLWAMTHPTPYARAVLRVASDEGLPPGLIWGLMRRESFFDAEVVSLAGAHGLMQLLPTTAESMAIAVGDPVPAVRELHRPRVNLRLGSAYLSQLLQESEGDVYQALSSYNAGEGNGRRWADRRDRSAPPAEMVLWISYAETRAYVFHVLRSWRLYQLTYDALACADGTHSP